MSARAQWFEVDHDGLAEIAKRRGMAFIVTEPIQNAWDEDVKEVHVTLTPVPGRSRSELVVRDDSQEGFRDMTDDETVLAWADGLLAGTKQNILSHEKVAAAATASAAAGF